MGCIVVGVTGASGVVLAYRLVQYLTEQKYQVHLVLSQAAGYTAVQEMGTDFGSVEKWIQQLPSRCREYVTSHSVRHFGASIASGSFPTDGMTLLPCSMATLAALAMGLSDNLIRRAADVTLKERRRLVVVPREAPLTEGHLENMIKVTRLGGIILPPVPAWYTHPQTMRQMEESIVGRVLDLLQVPHNLAPRWEGAEPEFRENWLKREELNAPISLQESC